jgi:hypothetical protein
VILPPLVFPGGMLRVQARFMLARVCTPSSLVRQREKERERERERCRERKGDGDREKERERGRERDVEYVQNCYFYF